MLLRGTAVAPLAAATGCSTSVCESTTTSTSAAAEDQDSQPLAQPDSLHVTGATRSSTDENANEKKDGDGSQRSSESSDSGFPIHVLLPAGTDLLIRIQPSDTILAVAAKTLDAVNSEAGAPMHFALSQIRLMRRRPVGIEHLTLSRTVRDD